MSSSGWAAGWFFVVSIDKMFLCLGVRETGEVSKAVLNSDALLALLTYEGGEMKLSKGVWALITFWAICVALLWKGV